MSSLEAGVQIGDFRIERRLGAGGMGVVYLARQVSFDRQVALKVLGAALNREEDIARFQREAQAIAKLHHTGIVAVHFIGQDGQACYLAMEFIDGSSLRRVIERLGRPGGAVETFDQALEGTSDIEPAAPTIRFDGPTGTYTPTTGGDDGEAVLGSPVEAERLMASLAYIRRCCEVARDAALALAHAHERGVVHRDIKPENLLLDRRGGVHLIDFGIARFFEDVTLTSTGALIGTPMYMSPEQVAGRIGIDHRTDIYSLGLVLYEMLTLRRPIVAPTREGILRQVVTKPLRPVSWANRAVPRDLEAVVHRATAKDPDERYPTAEALASDLRSVLDGRPVSAVPYRYRFDQKEVIAERPGGLVAVAFLLLLTTVLAFPVAMFLLQAFLEDPLLNTWRPLSLVKATIVLTFLVWSVASFVAAGGLLAGRRWAYLLTNLVCMAGYGVMTASYFIVTLTNPGRDISILFMAISIVIIIALGSPYWLAQAYLLRRGTRGWFRLAERLRGEHRRDATAS